MRMMACLMNSCKSRTANKSVGSGFGINDIYFFGLTFDEHS